MKSKKLFKFESYLHELFNGVAVIYKSSGKFVSWRKNHQFFGAGTKKEKKIYHLWHLLKTALRDLKYFKRLVTIMRLGKS